MSETKTIGTNKKMIIAIAALGVALLCVIGAMIGVFAATFQGVKSSFNVSYSATNVAATVSAKYQVLNSDEADMGSITFDPAEADSQEKTYKSLTEDATNITLTAVNKSVVFTYTFTNNSEDVPFTVKLINSPDIKH